MKLRASLRTSFRYLLAASRRPRKGADPQRPRTPPSSSALWTHGGGCDGRGERLDGLGAVSGSHP